MNKLIAVILAAFLSLCAASAGAGELITYYHSDLAGSPVSTTDSKGYEFWSADYEPYGYHRLNAVDTANSEDNIRWFASHVEDAATGLSYMGARYYDPALGRFLSLDPAGPDITNLRSFARYAYGNNSPYRYVDPDGANALSVLDWTDFAVDVGGLMVDEIVYGAAVINGNDAVAQLAIEGMVEKRMAAAQSTAGVISPLPGTGRMLKTSRAVRTAGEVLAENKKIGKAGEAIIEREIKESGEEIAGRQVTLETLDGVKSRVDWVTKEAKVIEGKTNGAELSKGQRAVRDAINRGEPVIPRGKNAEAAGLKPGEPIKMKEYEVKRCQIGGAQAGCGPG